MKMRVIQKTWLESLNQYDWSTTVPKRQMLTQFSCFAFSNHLQYVFFFHVVSVRAWVLGQWEKYNLDIDIYIGMKKKSPIL